MHTADSIVLVARCGSTSVASARRTAELIARLRVDVVGVVLIGIQTAGTADSKYYRKPPRRPVLREKPLRHGDAPALTAEPLTVARAAPSPAVDDGGIWRPKPVIDLSTADRRPVPGPTLSEEEAVRQPNASVGPRENLPLFRAGDGNGSSRGA
jgi:hypothetical protein